MVTFYVYVIQGLTGLAANIDDWYTVLMALFSVSTQVGPNASLC